MKLGVQMLFLLLCIKGVAESECVYVSKKRVSGEAEAGLKLSGMLMRWLLFVLGVQIHVYVIRLWVSICMSMRKGGYWRRG